MIFGLVSYLPLSHRVLPRTSTSNELYLETALKVEHVVLGATCSSQLPVELPKDPPAVGCQSAPGAGHLVTEVVDDATDEAVYELAVFFRR